MLQSPLLRKISSPFWTWHSKRYAYWARIWSSSSQVVHSTIWLIYNTFTTRMILECNICSFRSIICISSSKLNLLSTPSVEILRHGKDWIRTSVTWIHETHHESRIVLKANHVGKQLVQFFQGYPKVRYNGNLTSHISQTSSYIPRK